MNKYILGGFMLLAFAACRKKGSITGKITDYQTGEPISGMVLDVFEGHGAGVGWVGRYDSKKLAELTSDPSGSFNFNLSYKKRESYDYSLVLRYDRTLAVDTLPATEPFYFLYEPYDPAIPLSKNKEEYVEFKMRKGARLKFIATDLAPFNDVEWISAYAGDSLGAGFREDLYNSADPGLTAQDYKRVPADGKIFVYIREKRGATENFYYSTMNLQAFSKGTFHYNY